jgi:excisionase family DNA binding protein
MKTLSTTQVARLLCVSDQSISNWIDSGKLRAGKTPGGHRRVEHNDLVAFLKQQNFRIPHELLPAGTNILVMDAEKDASQRIKKALKAKYADWNILVAHDGFAAGEIVTTDRPNVVVLDLHMPGLDGFEVCRRIKANRLTRHTSVIAITAHPTPESEKAAMDAGASAYLTKPIEISQLSDVIQNLLPLHK